MEGTETPAPQRQFAQLLRASPGCVSSWSQRSRPRRSCHFTSGHPHSLLGICPQIPGLSEEPASHKLFALFPRSSPPSMVGRARPHGVFWPGGVLSGRRDPSCGTSLASAFSTRSKIKIHPHSMSIFIDLIMSLLRGTRCLASLLTLQRPHQRTA